MKLCIEHKLELACDYCLYGDNYDTRNYDTRCLIESLQRIFDDANSVERDEYIRTTAADAARSIFAYGEQFPKMIELFYPEFLGKWNACKLLA